MKPLSQMTREELWALDEKQVIDLALTHRLRVYMQGIQIDKEDLLEDLEELRLELQQDNADSRRETQEELTVDEEKQLKYDYAKASAKINPQDR